MEHLLMVVLGLTSVLVNAQLHGDNKCDLMTVSDLSASDSQVIEMVIPSECNEGNVDWHYPKGSIHLKLTRHGATFALCIEESWATMLGEIKEVTGGLDKLLPLPVAGKPVCTQNQNGVAEFLISAENTQYYMTTFKYSLKMSSP